MQKLEETRKFRGQLGPGSSIDVLTTIVVGIFLIAVLVYALYSLGTSLNNSNLTIMINNSVTGIINFTAQLGTLGTLLGVFLFVGVIFAAGLFAYGRMGRGGGGTGM